MIKEKKVLTEDTEKALLEALGEFSDTFTTSEGQILGRQPEVRAMDESEVGHEKVQVQRPAPPKK